MHFNTYYIAGNYYISYKKLQMCFFCGQYITIHVQNAFPNTTGKHPLWENLRTIKFNSKYIEVIWNKNFKTWLKLVWSFVLRTLKYFWEIFIYAKYISTYSLCYGLFSHHSDIRHTGRNKSEGKYPEHYCALKPKTT